MLLKHFALSLSILQESSSSLVIIPGVVLCLNALCVLGVFPPNPCSIDAGVRQATSHGIGLFMGRRSNFFPAPSLTRPSFLLCHAAMCLCIPYRLDKGRERSYSLLPLTFTSCFYNLSKAHCLHSGTGFVLKKRDNGERHHVISSGCWAEGRGLDVCAGACLYPLPSFWPF